MATMPGFVGALATALVLTTVAPGAADASAATATIRQLSGALPALFANPAAVAVAGDVTYVADTNAVFAVDDASGEVWVVAGRRNQRGAADGQGTAARFARPSGLAVVAGGLLVADTVNHTIRRIDLATGAVTTVAGAAGQSGSADGTAGAARFERPSGVAVDGTTAWVADTGNHTIRRLDLITGAVTTVAGAAGQSGTADGVGSAARFMTPGDLTRIGGQVWIADRIDARHATVRRLRVDTGQVTTPFVFDGGARTMATVTGLVGRIGALFVGVREVVRDDGDKFREGEVYRVDLATGMRTELPEHPYTPPPAGLARRGDDLVVAAGQGDYVPTVWAIDVGTGATRAVGGILETGAVDGAARTARFAAPNSIDTDDAGAFLYAIDNGVRRIDVATGETTTLLATYAEALVATGGVVYLGTSDAVVRYDPTTGAVDDFATLPGNALVLSGLETDGARLFAAGLSGDCAIYAIDVATAAVSVFAGSPSDCRQADGTGTAARFGGFGVYSMWDFSIRAGALWVSDIGGTIRRVDLATAAVTTLGSGPANNVGGIVATDDCVIAPTLWELRCFDPVTGASEPLDWPRGVPSPFSITYADQPLGAVDTSQAGLLDFTLSPDGGSVYVSEPTGVAVITLAGAVSV